MHDSFSPDIIVIGCGYVGYPLSLQFANAGYTVLAVDINSDVTTKVNAGLPPLTEPGFTDAARKVHDSRRLRSAAVPQPAEVFVIAVPTPLDHTRRAADLSIIAEAARSIVPYLQFGNLIILESTVPPGTCSRLLTPILEESGLIVGDDLLLAHCPERVYPGNILDELVHSDRVIGGVNERSTKSAMDLYSSFVRGKLTGTDIVTAELCKVMENTYRDVNIALSNQIAEIAESHGVDGAEVARIANGHPRVNYLTPGIGVGGHCIPIDPWFLLSESRQLDDGVIGAARRVNERQPHRIVQKIKVEIEGIEAPRIVLVGAAYKPGVADTRNSPALQIVEALTAEGIHVDVYDPLTVDYSGDLLQLVKGADLLAVLVPQPNVLRYLGSNREQIESVMRRPRIVDLSTGTLRQI